jgi:alpha-mannosidase
LAAVKHAEDGRGIVVRWYEAYGWKSTALVRTAFPLSAAELTNVVEAERRGALAVRGGHEVEVQTPAYGVVTVRLLPRAQGRARAGL